MMKGRFRKTDLFAVVGLVALLVWAPSYVASDDATRPLADGETFTLPDPRDGDRVVFELVIREEGKEPEVVGPIGEMTRRLAEPGEVPRDAVWVEEWVYFPLVTNLSIGELRAGGHDRAIYYGADGLPVWFTHGDHGQEIGLHPALRGSAVNDDQGRYRYTGDLAQATVLDVARFFGAAEERALSEALLHRGEAYMGGAGPLGHLWDRHFDIGDSQLSPHGDRIVLPWMFHNRGNLIFNHPPQHYTVEEWKWHHPEAAAAVGYHWGYAERGGRPFLEIDILPRSIERGTGDSLPAAARPEPWDAGNDFPRPPLDPAGVPFVPLKSLDADPRPVLSGISLPMLRNILQLEEGWAEALDNDAHIVGFYARHVNDAGTNWTLALLDADDNVTVGYVRVDLAGSLIQHAIFCSDRGSLRQERCSGVQGTNEPFHCHSLHTNWGVCPEQNPDPLYLERPVPDPWALWDSAGLPEAERKMVVFTPEPDLGPMNMPGIVPSRNSFEHFLIRTGTGRGGVDPHLGFTQLRSSGDPATTFEWNLMDGHLDRSAVPSAKAEPSVPLSEELPAGAIATPVGFVPATVATGGLLLIGIAALARGWGLLRLVALGGFAALYARIQDDAVLDHERRDEIMRIVRAEPGLTATELSTRLELAWGVTAHHLERLRRAGLVVTCRDGRRNHHFPAGLEHPESLIPKRNDDYETFLAAVTEHPGLALRDLDARLGRGRSTLSRTGSRLVRLGLVEKRRDGMVVRFYPCMDRTSLPSASADDPTQPSNPAPPSKPT